MQNLVKIKDVSAKYNVSARTLRYYEEIGLVQSTRSGDYAYRLYDEKAVKKLEQILILRKLNVSIKDIQRILDASGSEAVLAVLGEKVHDIDEEVALLHEMKAIVLSFIRQLEQADFSKASDVSGLYDKAREIETQLLSAAYAGNPAPTHRLLDVAERLEEKALARLQIPDNVLKRLLQNVYFIFGDGAAAADALGRRYDIFVYHTCDYRHAHRQNADIKFQPDLAHFAEDMPDFFALDPADAMRLERGVVRDFTPMVITDLIQLSAAHETIICENDMDIDSIIHIVTNAVIVSDNRSWSDFIAHYEEEIRRRDISAAEKERLICKVNDVWGGGKPENPRGTNPYGVKQIFTNEQSTVEQTADAIADYFGMQYN